MHRIFSKDQVLTIPNLLSVIRLALIPLIVWLYVGKQAYSIAVIIILLSGATDIIDGAIARRFHMVSDLGKILDPVADKMTQGAVILCLALKYRWMRGLIVLFIIKEISRIRIPGNSKEKCCQQCEMVRQTEYRRSVSCYDVPHPIPGHTGNAREYSDRNLFLPHAYIPCAVYTVLSEAVPYRLNPLIRGGIQ